MKSFTLTICLTGHIASSPSPEPKREVREPWRARLCASSSSPSVFSCASRQTGAYLEEHWSRGSTCASSLQGRAQCWTQFGTRGGGQFKADQMEGKEAYFQRKCGFLGTSDQEISRLGKSQLSFSSVISSSSFLKCKLKGKFSLQSLLLKLITKSQVL